MNVPAKVMAACLRNSSPMGMDTGGSCASARVNSGVSLIFSRTHKPSPTRIALARNGIRHPHAAKSASLNVAPISRNNPFAAINPMGAPNWGTIPKRARHPGGAYSTASNAAPPHSPPNPNPWPKRKIHSSNGAIQPAIA